MSDSVFQRAIKPLDFSPVSIKTPTKRDTYSVVWDVKKLLTYVTFSNQVITVAQAGAARLLYQYNFNYGKNVRILNFARIQSKLAPDLTIASINDVVYCVKCVKAGVTYRYKIAGRKSGQWIKDIGFPEVYFYDYTTPSLTQGVEPAMAVVAPWYDGEHIEPNFVLEIWSANRIKTTFTLTGNLVLELSTLTNPFSLTDRSLVTQGTGYTRAQLGFTYPQAVPEVYPAPTVGN